MALTSLRIRADNPDHALLRLMATPLNLDVVEGARMLVPAELRDVCPPLSQAYVAAGPRDYFLGNSIARDEWHLAKGRPHRHRAGHAILAALGLVFPGTITLLALTCTQLRISPTSMAILVKARGDPVLTAADKFR